MTDIPNDICWAEREAFMTGILDRLDKGELCDRLRAKAAEMADEIVRDLEFAIKDHATVNAAHNISQTAERMAVQMLERIILGDEEAFLHLIGSSAWTRREGRRMFPWNSGTEFRQAILRQNSGLFVSEILADLQTKVEAMEARGRRW